MRQWLRRCGLCYSAGAVGALAKSGFVGLCARFEIVAALVAPLTAALAPMGLYSRLVWGGLYALLFALPLARSSFLLRALTGALVVSVIQILLLPLLQHSALHLLSLTTLGVLLLNCVWGLATVGVLRLVE